MKVSEQLSILFVLEKSEMTKDGKAPIYARITANGTRKEISLGVKVFPGQWDQKAGIVTGSGSEVARINSTITKVKAKLQQIELLLSAQYEYVTAEMIKKAYKEGWENQSQKIKERTLCQVCNYKYSKFAVLVKAGERSENTLKRWRTTKRKIREFLHFKFKKWDVPLSVLKYAHAQDFLHFLLTKQGIDENTASKYLKNTRELLEIAKTQEWIVNNPWDGYKIKYIQPERECLSMQEIVRLYQKPLIERLDHVRNIFLFACFTGYAFQEVLSLTKDDIIIGIDGKRWVKIDRQKTGNPEYLPLLPIPAKIIDRYANDPYCIANNKLLPVKSYQNYNGYLKEVADICEIPIDLSTHIARHTFATTICLDNDVPIETVSRMLGHKNIRTTQIYARVSKKKISNNMDELERKLFSADGQLQLYPKDSEGSARQAI
ncbi:MAG TPA: site-specific integrase [Parasegetibacter sp.]|jgi:site-specific recombinase XerD